jgi:hypothetical protein
VARDITKLCTLLEGKGQGLESTDLRLQELTDLVERDRIDGAADAAEAILGEGTLDIRPVTVVLYAAFVERGLDALPAVIAAVDKAITDNFDAIGPQEKKKPLFDKRIGWLFERIADQLEYHEKSRSDQWFAWSTDVPNERTELGAATGSVLAAALSVNAYASARSVGRVAAFLRDRADATKASSELTQNNIVVPEPPPPAKVGRVPDGAESGRVTLACSHRFVEMCRKLRAFEELIVRRRYDKAALVAADLQTLIGNFDPRAYFPELFADFAALYSENIDTLSGYMENRESPGWAAMDQFYRVDIEAFVER